MKKVLSFLLVISVLLCSSNMRSISPSAVKQVIFRGIFAVAAARIAQCMYRMFVTPDTRMPDLASLGAMTFTPIFGEEPVDPSIVIIKEKNAIKKALWNPEKFEKVIIAINDQLFLVQHGIDPKLKDYPHVTIRCGGYCDPKAYAAYVGLKAGNINGACVVFDFPTSTRAAFNYCQKQDIHCLELIYQELLKLNPAINVLFSGACKGATNILRFLAGKAAAGESTTNIKVATLESPTISPEHANEQWPLVNRLMPMIFPNYNPYGTTILNATRMPAVPILIGRLPKDSVSKYHHTSLLVAHLRKIASDANIYLLTTVHSEIVHGQLGKAKDYQKVLTEFFKHHGLPCRESSLSLLSQASKEV